MRKYEWRSKSANHADCLELSSSQIGDESRRAVCLSWSRPHIIASASTSLQPVTIRGPRDCLALPVVNAILRVYSLYGAHTCVYTNTYEIEDPIARFKETLPSRPLASGSLSRRGSPPAHGGCLDATITCIPIRCIRIYIYIYIYVCISWGKESERWGSGTHSVHHTHVRSSEANRSPSRNPLAMSRVSWCPQVRPILAMCYHHSPVPGNLFTEPSSAFTGQHISLHRVYQVSRHSLNLTLCQ